MDLTLIAIIILAAMIFVLSGMVGYLYWQQTRMNQQIQSLTLAITNHLQPAVPPSPVHVERVDDEEDVQETAIEEVVDDRVSVVEEAVEHVEGPPQPATESAEVDVDDIQHKTVKQLHEILTKKGIPFGKRDAKPVLIELIKATA